MQNLSLSGALMTSDSVFRINSLIEVSIAPPPPSTRTAVIKALVSRKFNKNARLAKLER
jgi:hypothetical protein